MKKTITIQKEVELCDECGEEIIGVDDGKTFKCMITGKELCRECTRFMTLVLCKDEMDKINNTSSIKWSHDATFDIDWVKRL